jgi:DNA-binding MarR family transcriptional regulator
MEALAQDTCLKVRQRRLLLAFSAPMTVSQLAGHVGMARRQYSQSLRALVRQELAVCLTPRARRSRVYWLTKKGCEARRRLIGHEAAPATGIDWGLYGWVCFSHRAAVLKALDEPRQPADIKRAARSRDPGLRMSANNVRDVIGEFRDQGLVHPVYERRHAHPSYALTDRGSALRDHLLVAETPPAHARNS